MKHISFISQFCVVFGLLGLLYWGITDKQNSPLKTIQNKKKLCSKETSAVLREKQGGEEGGGKQRLINDFSLLDVKGGSEPLSNYLCSVWSPNWGISARPIKSTWLQSLISRAIRIYTLSVCVRGIVKLLKIKPCIPHVDVYALKGIAQ